jgi:hypothetical protein
VSLNENGNCVGPADCPGVGGTDLRGTPRNDNVKRAADFNGTTDCITIADDPDHSLPLNEPVDLPGGEKGLTFSAWILPRSLPRPGPGVAIVSKYSSGADQREWILGIRNDRDNPNDSVSPRFTFWKSSDGTSSLTTAVYSNRVLRATDLNRWTHVVLRINSDSAYEWWINGRIDVDDGIPRELRNPTFKAGNATTRSGCVERSASAPDMLFHGKIELLVARSYTLT